MSKRKRNSSRKSALNRRAWRNGKGKHQEPGIYEGTVLKGKVSVKEDVPNRAKKRMDNSWNSHRIGRKAKASARQARRDRITKVRRKLREQRKATLKTAARASA